MKKIIAPLLFALLSTTAFATTSMDFVKNESNNVFSIVQKNKDLKSFKKELSTKTNIDEVIDFPRIARMTVGKHWRTATEEQKTAFVKEFRDFLFNFYGNAMFNFKDASINYKSENVDGENATVKTIVTYSEGGKKKQAKVDYMLAKDGDSWKMVDVVIEGITLTLSYKDSFGQIISTKGLDGLIAELKEKNNKNKSS